jgi:hypothetical protein
MFEGYNQKFYYKNNKYEYFEDPYKTDFLKQLKPDSKPRCLGSLDIETYSLKSRKTDLKDLTLPYACGFNYKDDLKDFYIKDGESPINVVVRMLKELVVRKYQGLSFYVHNLAGFDSRFILSALGNIPGFDVKTMGKTMNEIFSIKVSRVLKQNSRTGAMSKRPISITLKDSYYMLANSLASLSKTFAGENETDLIKGSHPHAFMTPETLHYVGEIPARKYFGKSLSLKEYREIAKKFCVEKPWNAKEKCLEYLRTDLKSLVNVMDKFNKRIFELFNVDASKISSYSGLAKAIYLVKYYVEKHRIPIITGFVDMFIRKGYIGGIVDVVKHVIFNAYKYDVNSHYPACMLKDMPVGTPRLTDCKDLDKLFGFVVAKVTAPSAKELAVPILPITDDGGRVRCPRGTFKYI